MNLSIRLLIKIYFILNKSLKNLSLKLTLGLIFIIFISPSTQAADGSSGCGPGWYVFKDNSLVSSALRSTTNGILFPVYTLGMTFGTSNCTQHKIVKTEKQSLYFVTMNMYELKTEAVKGNGEFIFALAKTLGCNSGSELEFGAALKKDYESIFKSLDPEKTLFEVYRTLFTNKFLTEQCSLKSLS